MRYEPEPPTLEHLAELLQTHASASTAEIDREEGRFLFFFALSGGGAACHGGTPWAILREPDESPKLNPLLEALLNNSGLASDHEAPYVGFAKIGSDEAAEGARQSEGVRFATGLVWRQFMLPAFNRAVKAGRVQLFARAPSLLAGFQRLPSDIWLQLEILDWEHGIACDIHGEIYSSIHVADSASPITVGQAERSSQSSKDDAWTALHRRIREAVTELWPSGDMPARAKDRDEAIRDWFSHKNETPPHDRSIRRALAQAPDSDHGDH
ncbi:hypothetical protein [Bradyrhizobium cenepequi]